MLQIPPNRPPRNGSCLISPSSGYALQTKFGFSCQNWKDEDNKNSPFIYWVTLRNEEGKRNILLRGIQSSGSVDLPPGKNVDDWKVMVQVLVEDSLGALAIGFDG